MNQFAASGVDPGSVERGGAGEADRGARQHSAPGVHGRPRRKRRPGLLGRRLSRRRADHGHIRARAARRPGARGEPPAGRGLPRRQAGSPRLLRGPGHEGDGRPREPEARQRSPARKARRLTVSRARRPASPGGAVPAGTSCRRSAARRQPFETAWPTPVPAWMASRSPPDQPGVSLRLTAGQREDAAAVVVGPEVTQLVGDRESSPRRRRRARADRDAEPPQTDPESPDGDRPRGAVHLE